MVGAAVGALWALCWGVVGFEEGSVVGLTVAWWIGSRAIDLSYLASSPVSVSGMIFVQSLQAFPLIFAVALYFHLLPRRSQHSGSLS